MWDTFNPLRTVIQDLPGSDPSTSQAPIHPAAGQSPSDLTICLSRNLMWAYVQTRVTKRKILRASLFPTEELLRAITDTLGIKGENRVVFT